MSSNKETAYYIELQPGDAVQDGDQWMDSFGQWQPYVCSAHISGVVFAGVKARRPIRTTHQTTYEEVPGSRTTQDAVVQPQREQIAYEELQPGDVIQEGDEWQNSDGRWHPLVLTPGASREVRDGIRARRPHNITPLQRERDEFQTALIESRLALKRKVAEMMEVCKERDDAENALKSAQRARDELQRQVDELRADRTNEVTARQVQEVLRRWATELDWSADCFGSATREQVHGVQNTLIAVMQRIESMIDAEAASADA